MSWLRRVCAVGAVGVVGIALVATASALDAVRTHEGRTYSGTIDSIGRDKVKITAVNKEQTEINVNEIESIRFDGEPAQLNLVRSAVRGGNYESALKTLENEALNPAKMARLEIRQDIEFFTALSKARLAQNEQEQRAAGTLLNNFVKEHGGSYHFYEATEAIGDLLIELGKPADALPHYQRLEQAPWIDYKMRGAVARGRALKNDNKFTEALKAFDDALKLAEGKTESLIATQLLAATVGKAACLAATGKASEGIKLVEDVINKADPENKELHAVAYVTLGNCYQAADRPKDALMAYLHVDVLYFAYPQYHAEALYNLAKLWKVGGKPERGLEAHRILAERYPTSPWAKKPL